MHDLWDIITRVISKPNPMTDDYNQKNKNDLLSHTFIGG